MTNVTNLLQILLITSFLVAFAQSTPTGLKGGRSVSAKGGKKKSAKGGKKSKQSHDEDDDDWQNK